MSKCLRKLKCKRRFFVNYFVVSLVLMLLACLMVMLFKHHIYAMVSHCYSLTYHEFMHHVFGFMSLWKALIVQFALERRRTGMAIKYSAILGAGARLRPILMTSLAMIIGLLPLMFASGVGKNGNQTLGAAAVGGMLIGTLLQVFVVPALFAVFQWLQEKVKPIEFEDDNAQIDTELLQYTHPLGKMKK